MKFITASYSDALALESAEKSRDLIRSDKFKMLFPNIEIKQDKDTKSNFRVVKREQACKGFMARVVYGGGRFSTSVGGAATGFHGHILIIDDPLNPKQSVSEKFLQNANAWMDQTLSTRKTDKEVSTTILIMQRLHQDDPTGHLLAKNKKNVKHICLPGEINTYREKVKPVELLQYYVNNLLDPIRLNELVLKELEADLGQYGYAGQIGQNPTPPGGGMFKVDHIQIIQTMPIDINFQTIIRYWDKAGSQDTGCFTAGVKMAKLVNGRYLILDVKKGQWAAEERERIIKEVAYADTSKVIIGVEQEGGSGGKESAEATVRNLVGFSVYLDHPSGDKIFRADPFSVQVNNGNVQLLQGDWNQAYIEELRGFPFGKYKDQVDASSAAFNKLAVKRMAGVVR
jgi:predicted phage terminase large subunit-like protein